MLVSFKITDQKGKITPSLNAKTGARGLPGAREGSTAMSAFAAHCEDEGLAGGSQIARVDQAVRKDQSHVLSCSL